MKKIALIFILLSFRLVAQLGPPSLRCIEVIPNGNIKLTWLPPSGPGNIFDSFEIFSSAALTGPYTSVGSVASIGVNNFTHTTTNGTVQSLYYYVKTKFGPGGINVSASSDTLRSIFLNAVQSTPDVKLSYNDLHLPKLITTSSSFTVAKEYPSATWNNIGTTTLLKYGDTISVCSTSLNYAVSIADNSGCISISNIQGGVFTDTKAPDEPVIDSISVLPNGQTVIAYTIPRDMDVIKYQVYENLSGINTGIDIVPGRNNTIYTYTVTKALTQQVKLYIAAIDSCGKISSFDTKPTTMYLQTQYNTCEYSTNLTWNAYQGMKKGVSEYRIYYSVNGSAFQVVGSTTGTSFIHQGVEPSQNVCYFVRVFNGDKTITSSSNQRCFFSTQAVAPAFVYIRNVSILTKSSAEIKIYLDISKNSTGIDLTRSEDGVNFSSVAFIPFNGTDQYSYVDESVDARTTSYFYRAIVRDSCGNPRIKSKDAKTVLLKVKEDKDMLFDKHLTWTDYKGYDGGVSGYNIYRIVNDVNSGTPVGSTGPSDTTFTDNIEDEAPNGSKIEYMVEAVEGISNQYGYLEKSNSNIEEIYQEAKIFIPTAFAPNGINKVWLPITHFVDKSEYSLSIFNKWGNKLFETTSDKDGWDGKNGKPDVYIYFIAYRNSRGEYIELKGTFAML